MRPVPALLLACVACSWVHVSSQQQLHSPVDCPPCNCTRNVTTGDVTADCSHLNLTELPPLPENTSVLLLNDNPLTNLSGHPFSQQSRLRLLNVGRCGLTSISQEAFAALGLVETLDVSGNPDLGLEMLTSALRGLPANASLKILRAAQVVPDLSVGVAVSVDLAEALQLLPLEDLVLDNNQIEAVCDGVLERLPVTLTTLSVRRNRLRPGLYMFSLHKLKNLVRLAAGDQFAIFDATDAWEHGFPPSPVTESTRNRLFQRVLQSLDAQASLPARWGDEMTKWLYSTVTSDCQSPFLGTTFLSSGEGAVCNSPDSVHETHGFLMQLYYKDTFTIRLPPKLEYLELNGNGLSFPLRNLTLEAPSLRELHLARNNFSIFMGPIWGLDNLEMLDMSYNYGLVISSYFFSYFKHLESLNLLSNVFGFWGNFDSLPFTDLASLRYLNLGINYLTHLPTEFFSGLNMLEYINLRLNALNDWNPDISHMHNLVELDIHLNYFTSIPLRLRQQLDELCNERKDRSQCVYVPLFKNHFECNCITLDSWMWLQNYPNFVRSGHGYDAEHTYCSLVDGSLVNIGDHDNVTRLVDMLEHACTNYVMMVASIVSCLLVCLGLLVGALLYRRCRWREPDDVISG